MNVVCNRYHIRKPSQSFNHFCSQSFVTLNQYFIHLCYLVQKLGNFLQIKQSESEKEHQRNEWQTRKCKKSKASSERINRKQTGTNMTVFNNYTKVNEWIETRQIANIPGHAHANYGSNVEKDVAKQNNTKQGCIIMSKPW
jgi:hypothetical protein